MIGGPNTTQMIGHRKNLTVIRS